MTDELPPDPNHPRQVACCAYADAYSKMSTAAYTHLKTTYPANTTHANTKALEELLRDNTPTTQLLHYGWGIITFGSEEVDGMRLCYFVDGNGAHVYGQPLRHRPVQTGDPMPSRNNQYSFYYDLTHAQALVAYDKLNPETPHTLLDHLNGELDGMVLAAPPPQPEE